MAELTKRPVIGVTVGDPAGIGPEIVIKALGHPRIYNEVKPLVFADRPDFGANGKDAVCGYGLCTP